MWDIPDALDIEYIILDERCTNDIRVTLTFVPRPKKELVSNNMQTLYRVTGGETPTVMPGEEPIVTQVNEDTAPELTTDIYPANIQFHNR